ncbi:MAG: riboflavin synthase [Thermodesulfobacteriota bacterium]
MFTGIIEGLGTIAAVRSAGQGRQLTIEADFDLETVRIGDSIAVSGACLTAVGIQGRRFQVDVAPETLSRTTLGKAVVGARVNLERALRLSDRLDGHLVSGHVDGIGRLKALRPEGNALVITITVPDNLGRYIIEKGSVAVDGISLTVNRLRDDGFDVSIIPHTAKLTTIGLKQAGAEVNIENDMIGKYVERFLLKAEGGGRPGQGINLNFLAENGFLRRT